MEPGAFDARLEDRQVRGEVKKRREFCMARTKREVHDSSIILSEEKMSDQPIFKLIICYPLSEDQFKQILKSSNNKWKEWAKDVFLIAIGIALKIIVIWGMVVFYAYQNADTQGLVQKIDSWEYYVLLICVIFAGISYHFISKKYATEEDKLVDEIKAFYKEKKNHGKVSR